MFIKDFELTPKLAKMLDAIGKVECGRYGMTVEELEAIVCKYNGGLFNVASDSFLLGFSRGQQRIKRLMKKQEGERKNNALREILDRFGMLPEDQQEKIVDIMEAAICKVLG